MWKGAGDRFEGISSVFGHGDDSGYGPDGHCHKNTRLFVFGKINSLTCKTKNFLMFTSNYYTVLFPIHFPKSPWVKELLLTL